MDPWRFAEALRRHAGWIVLSGLAVAMIGAYVAYLVQSSSASAKLLHALSPGAAALKLESDASKPYAQSLQVSVDLLRSPELHRRVAKASRLPLKGGEVGTHSSVAAASPSDPITITVRRHNPADAVLLVNAYAREAVRLSTEQQHEELTQIQTYLKTKLADTDRDVKDVSRKLVRSKAAPELARSDAGTLAMLQERTDLERQAEGLRFKLSGLEMKIERLVAEIIKQHPSLVKAQEDLDRALVKFTEEHPKVKDLRATVKEIRGQIAQQATNVQAELSFASQSTASSLYLRVVDLQTERIDLDKQLEEISANSKRVQERLQRLPESQLEYSTLNTEYQALKLRQELLTKSKSEVQFLLENASGSLRILQWARDEDVWTRARMQFALVAGLAAGVLAAFVGALFVSAVELADGRIRTPRDLERATRLPVLATLGDLKGMTEEDLDQWAFRTLMIIKGKLGKTGGQSLVCGFISAAHGEGRSTWVNLLAKAARRCGHRVVVISPPQSSSAEPSVEVPPPAAEPLGTLEPQPDAAQSIVRSDMPPIVQLTIPDASWNLEWRQRWHQGLQQWKRMDNLALFVELPPASDPEAVLLSEQVPQLIWLCSKDQVTTTQTRSQMETLRYSRCGLVGSVFNRAAVPTWRQRFAHLARAAALLLAVSNADVRAQQAPAASAAPILSITSPDRLADWQKRLTLGPGDVLNVTIYDEADSARHGLVIGPDGRLNYLEAQDVTAAGLSVDELRARLEEILGKYHRSPRTVILPTAYNSKRFFMLGHVTKKGVFPLSRPITVVEAVAQASGFVTRDGLILADLPRSFWIRRGTNGTFAPVKVDFEALFLQGDLTQNQPLAPDDYLYFPPGDSPDVYLVGEVISPGPVAFTPELTALKAIITRGGYSDRSYRQRILVIRGSLSHPEAFVLNTAEILAAKGTDFKLQPKDIIYVSKKPWSFPQELLESAVFDFIRAAVTTWTGANVGPFIKEPIF